MPLHCTAMGKAALARGDQHPYEVLGPEPWTAYTDRTLTTLEGLQSELSAVRKDGYAMDRGEYHPGFYCIGVALKQQQEMYTISLTGLGESQEEHAEIIDDLLKLKEQFDL